MSSDIHCNVLYNDHRNITSLGVCHEYLMSSDVPVGARPINDMDTDLHLENVMCKAECSMVHGEVTALPLEMEKSRLNNPLDLTKLEVPTSQLCRVCATSSEPLTPIFGKKSKEMELVKKIHTHLPILVNENDVLPVNVCDTCVEKLQICHNLVTTCSESDIKLRQMMGLPIEKDMPEMEAVNVDVIGKEEPLCDKPLREDQLNESEPEEKEEKRDYDSDWEDQRASEPPSPAPSEPKRKRGVAKVRQRKINISAKLKQPVKNQKYKIVMVKTKSKSPMTQKDILNILKTQGDQHKLFVPGKKYKTSILRRHSYEKHMIRHAPALNEVDTVAPLSLPATTSVDDCTEDIKPDNLEITSVLNVQVEAPRCMTRSASKLNNANIRMEMSQEFQSVSKNIQSKILGTIRKLASNSKENKEKGLLINTEGVRVNNENVRVKIIGGTKVLIERKMKKPPSKYGWYCRQCDVMFESSEELDDHKGKDMCSNHPCQFCDKKFKTKNSLVKHERLHTNERPYMCEQCGKSFRTRTILRSHLDTHDKSRKFVCTDCGKAFNNKANFKHHTATHLNRAFLCDICGKTLKSLSYLRVHKLNHKNPDLLKRFACDMCGNKYVSRHQMRQHRRLHTNERPYKCPDPNCFKMFRNLVTLKQHASVHTNMRKYKCEACGKGFKRRSHLMTHRKTHDQHQRFRCGICPDSFNNLGELLSHRSSHTEEELKLANKDSLKCPECSKILLNKVTLKNHMLTHSNERPFPCSFCEKSFKNKTHRDNHLRLHTGEKPFICRFCKAAFTVSERLVVHERIHTGETPFKCNMCDKAFRSKINLIQHSKIHSDNRPFICSLCARAFRRREALDMHMRTHTGERPYACKMCGRAFKQKGDCNKHQKTHFKSGGPVLETPLV
uniref:Zinc finger protein n=1 Tax=Timema genevievae TaxID=629358 RepID=A0A7R9JWH5_TIMGE|nr:unnamed protein product [Timema genevievae]